MTATATSPGGTARHDDRSDDERLATPVGTRADLERLSSADQLRLAAWLHKANPPRIMPPTAKRRRRRVLTTATAAATLLVPWIFVLAATLPNRQQAQEWRIAWVAFDTALLVVLGATAWFGWRGRQGVITGFAVSATLLLCDAWFDVALSWGSNEQTASLITAFAIEVPLALFFFRVYHRLIRTVTIEAWRGQGLSGKPPPLRRARCRHAGKAGRQAAPTQAAATARAVVDNSVSSSHR
jgi:hypothetical protein